MKLFKEVSFSCIFSDVNSFGYFTVYEKNVLSCTFCLALPKPVVLIQPNNGCFITCYLHSFSFQKETTRLLQIKCKAKHTNNSKRQNQATITISFLFPFVEICKCNREKEERVKKHNRTMKSSLIKDLWQPRELVQSIEDPPQ